MFNNIGGKIKGLAVALFAFPAMLEILIGLLMIAADDELAFFGILIMIGGPILAWISSWLLYGYGELIEKATQIELNTRREGKTEEKPKGDPERINRIERLRAQGLITEEEYQKAISNAQ